MSVSASRWPDYCCVILTDGEGRLILQRRGPDARRAANRITCLGGKREPDEDPLTCIRRELIEEIGQAPTRLDLSVMLTVEGGLTAWFYRGELNHPVEELVLEPGIAVMLARPEELGGLPVHPWHAVAIEADRRGEATVVVPRQVRGESTAAASQAEGDLPLRADERGVAPDPRGPEGDAPS